MNEFATIVVRTDKGHRLIQSIDSATTAMRNAFQFLPEQRRAWLLKEMTREHERLMASPKEGV